MFGGNEVAKPFNRDGRILTVHSVFATLQGEGPDAGRPAVFVRLSRCHLKCYYCDTEFETGETLPVHEIVQRIEDVGTALGRVSLVVITGGEPLLQNFLPLVDAINRKLHWSVSVETAGAMDLVPGFVDWFAPDRSKYGNLVVCSPKTPRLHPMVPPVIGAYKYVLCATAVDQHDGLPCGSTQQRGVAARLARPPNWDVPIYVQPCDEQDPKRNADNLKAATQSCLKYGYRLGVQIHKLTNLP